MKLKKDERIDELQCGNLKIIQNKQGFCFGIDSVILTEFADKIKTTDNVLDLGTGTGILGLLVYGKRKPNSIVGVEIQEEVADMAKRSVELNKLEKNIKIINEDINKIIDKNLIEKNYFDIVITNPPYKEINTGLINDNEKKLISRHEIKASLEDFIKVAAAALKDKGILYMVHRPERLVDIIYLLRKYKVEPKEIRFVCPNIDKASNLVLIKCVKGGNKFLKINKVLYIYNKDGEYSEEIKKIYNK